MKLLDWVIVIILIACVLIAMLIYYQKTINECTKNPFVYGSKELTKQTGYEFQGYGWFVTPKYTDKKFYFNSTSSEYKK